MLSGTVHVGPLPNSNYPADPGEHDVAIVDLGTLGQVGAVRALTTGDTKGNSTAFASAADVALVNNVANSFPAVSAELISATCTASGTATSGSSVFTNASIAGTALVNATPSANTVLLNTPGLLKVVLNEQTDSGGVLTVNALHVYLGPIVNGAGTLGDVIVAHATCGPNTPVVIGAAFSFQDLPIILGGIAVLVVIGLGVRAGARRIIRATV